MQYMYEDDKKVTVILDVIISCAWHKYLKNTDNIRYKAHSGFVCFRYSSSV